MIQVAVAEPLQVQRDDAVARKIDAALLLILDRFAFRTDVAVDVYRGRRAPARLFGQVQDRRGLESGYDLIPQLAHAVAGAGGDLAQIVESRGGIHPLARPAVVDHVVEQLTPETGRFGRPLRGGSGCGSRGNLPVEVLAQLERHHIGRLQ